MPAPFQVCLLNPGHYRAVDELLRAETKGRGQMELLNLKEIREGDSALE